MKVMFQACTRSSATWTLRCQASQTSSSCTPSQTWDNPTYSSRTCSLPSGWLVAGRDGCPGNTDYLNWILLSFSLVSSLHNLMTQMGVGGYVMNWQELKVGKVTLVNEWYCFPDNKLAHDVWSNICYQANGFSQISFFAESVLKLWPYVSQVLNTCGL